MDHLEDLVSSLCPFRWVWDWHLGLCNPFKTLWFSSKQKKSQWGVWEQTAMSDAEWPGEGITFCKDGHSQCRPEEGDGVAGRGHLGSRVFGSSGLEWGSWGQTVKDGSRASCDFVWCLDLTRLRCLWQSLSDYTLTAENFWNNYWLKLLRDTQPESHDWAESSKTPEHPDPENWDSIFSISFWVGSVGFCSVAFFLQREAFETLTFNLSNSWTIFCVKRGDKLLWTHLRIYSTLTVHHLTHSICLEI